MEYKKIFFSLDPDTEINRDILMAKLGESGFDSFIESDSGVEAYIAANLFLEESIINRTLSDFPFFTFNYIIETLPDQNWNEVWEKNYFKPLLIEKDCLIRAPFHSEFPPSRYEIVIEPKMAFGTGNHETTSLMISEILRMELTGKEVLDMGCGTGVLGILASMRGAWKVSAIDIDENACRASAENISYNKISNMEVRLGGAEQLGNEKFDIILANIQRNILLQDMPAYFEVLNCGGLLLMSGFYATDLESIKEKAISCGLDFINFKEKNNWIVATFTRK